MFRQKKRCISFICLPGPQFCKSTQHSGLGLRRENGRFLGLRFLSPHFMLALEQRRDVWILSSGKNTAYLESFPCVTLIYYFRPTFKNNFLVFESWFRTWNGFWFWLQLSTLQKAITWVPMWFNCNHLCLSVLSPFFCEEAKPVGFFWLACFYSFLVCFYSREFAKLLHPVLNWVGSQKCPEWWFCFWKWGYCEIRWFWGHIFLCLSGSWKLIISVCVCVCVCACQVASVASNSLQT